ncbi:MAG: transposase, partial [Bacteroidota bacterium]|nr:transposase [Bacteroidota bacterium]
MFDNYVKLDEPIWLSENDELVITESIAEVAKEDRLNILEYNICGDHMHILLICEKEKLSTIVGKLKAISSRKCNIARGRTSTRGHAPLSGTSLGIGESSETRGHVPLSGTSLGIGEASETRGHVPLSGTSL